MQPPRVVIKSETSSFALLEFQPSANILVLRLSAALIIRLRGESFRTERPPCEYSNEHLIILINAKWYKFQRLIGRF